MTSMSSGSGAYSTLDQSGGAAVEQPVAAPADARVVDLGLAVAGIGGAERLVRLLGVRVGGVLGEDREDQLARRVEARLPDLLAVDRR